MKSLFFTLFTLEMATICLAQSGDCGPYSQRSNVVKVLDSTTRTYPFNCLVHIETVKHSGKLHWGTGTFVSDDCILTAHHVLFAENYSKINLIVPHDTTSKDIRIELVQADSDYKMIFYKPYPNKRNYNAVSNDIAIIKITNKEKLKQLYRAKLPYTMINDSSEVSEFHLTGYPSDFGTYAGNYDTLITRTAESKDMDISTDSNFINYPFFACSGDSGAPIWAIKNTIAYVIGVHHGASSKTKNKAVRLDTEMIKWLKLNTGN